MEHLTKDRRQQDGRRLGLIGTPLVVWLLAASMLPAPYAHASHGGHGSVASEDSHRAPMGSGYPIPGASFRVFLDRGPHAEGANLDAGQAEAAAQTVVDALTLMMQRRSDFPRFDEAVKKELVESVVIEPTVVNREGKEFPFLVARTKDAGRVKLLISASSLEEKGYLRHPDRLAPILAREFQWVVSKADTSPKPTTVSAARDVAHAPIRTDKEIREMSGEERSQVLQQLFDTYLTTVDDYKSLDGRPFYEVGTTTLLPPAQPDSTTKHYDIRVREALQKIVREPSFMDQTPRAVRSLLNGKIWNVAFVNIEQRDWATRTRVLPQDKAVSVGAREHKIQPASILVNVYRTAAPDDPFYRETQGLPMGALSADQLARVIALEIEHNITEKSMTGHVAQDAATAPK
ncbi:hypothetical protein [Candidatus Nitrospira bockiana]